MYSRNNMSALLCIISVWTFSYTQVKITCTQSCPLRRAIPFCPTMNIKHAESLGMSGRRRKQRAIYIKVIAAAGHDGSITVYCVI